ncbi:MAG: hypothetical protein JXA89_23405 [Anaerolineae bacterium]|nr:hypothetical protein [Anaerolineae bacterium]
MAEVYQVAWACVYLAQGKSEKVLAIYDQICDAARTAGRMVRVVEISLLKALALQAQDQPEAALVPLEQCLSWAEQEGYVRLFLEAGQGISSLLQLASGHSISPNYTRTLLAAMDISLPESQTTVPHRSQPLIEPLTKRERQVLLLIGDGLSNRDIAEKLVVSLNTVKKHSSNLYGKLGVTSRTQAITRARELDLL